MKKILLLTLTLSAFIVKIDAQSIGLKSNLLYSASLSPNLGIEIGLSPQTTIDISASFNPFTFSDGRKWKHWLVQPEFRWWTCERFNGHFLAAHLIGGGFNVDNVDFFPFSMWDSLKEYRYKGHALGAGLGYGYAWMLGKHWNLEAEIAFGAAYTNFDKYYCPKCGEKIGTDNHIYVGPTKAAINLVYLF